jgi:hypothetical protein
MEGSEGEGDEQYWFQAWYTGTTVLGRRRRRYPSLQAFVTSPHQRRQDDRRGPPFVLLIARRRPTTKLSIPRPHPTWRPTRDSAHCNRPCMERRVMGLICNSFSVMTVCNPPLWEYSGDSLSARGHKRPYNGTLDSRAPINTPVQCPWETRLTEQLSSRVKPCLHSFHSPVGSTYPGEQVLTNCK